MRTLAAVLAAASSFVVTAGSGCAAAEAPEGLDNLSRFVWDRFEPAEGLEAGTQVSELQEAVEKMRAEFDGLDVTYDTPFTGTLKDLEEERIVDLPDVGASRAKDIELGQGFVIANTSTCTQQQHVNLLASNRSIEIHPDVYESYDKDFDGDAGAFRDGDVDFLTYETRYKILQPPVGSAYSARLNAAARRVRTDDGDVILTRVYLAEPATFDGEGSAFDLDFQMEMYFEKDGETAHFYSMWRRMVLGPVDNSSELFISQTLGGFVDWEREVDVACEQGLLDD